MKKFTYCLVVAVLLASLCSGCAPKPAPTPTPPTPEPIVLKAVQCFPSGHVCLTMWAEFIDRVNEQAKGKLKIELLGGPEVIPVMDQVNALKEGNVMDILATTNGYYIPIVPEIQILHVAGIASPKKEREIGFYDLMNEVHMKKGLYYLGRTSWAAPYHLWLNEPAETLQDLVGRTIRGGGGYPPFLKALGMVPVEVAMPEIYTSLERGIVDGFMWPMVGAADYGWLEVTKYCVDHPMGVTSVVTLMNLDSWNALPKDLQDLLIKIQIGVEEDAVTSWSKITEMERQKVRDAGVKFITFSPDEAKRFVNTFYNCSWEQAEKRGDPEAMARFRELCGR